MEKYIQRLSFVITFILVYVGAAYIYLSYKGFEYRNGTFELVSSAQAFSWDENNTDLQEKQYATPIESHIALNLPKQNIEGSKKAPLTIYEFSSLGCTHCADFHLNILPKLREEYFDTEKVQLVFVDFPLDKRSMQASMLSHCVNPFDRAEFLSFVFSKQREWILTREPEKYLISYAKEYGLSEDEALKCLKNDSIAKEIMFNRQEAIDKLKIEGTPAFLISNSERNEIIYGISNVTDFKAYLNERLGKSVIAEQQLIEK